MTTIHANLQRVHAHIMRACQEAGRDAATVRLLAVSKTWPADAVRAAALAGQHAFGESYVQEALAKMAALSDLPLEWHFIGPLQGNKTRAVAEHFSWVHSVDRLRIAQRLSSQRPATVPPLNVCIEVNISGEASKGGCAPAEAADLAAAVAQLPHLRLRGLMAIPEASNEVLVQRARFAQVRALAEQIRVERSLPLDTLSLGMSNDLSAAIIEGSTLVRVGTAIFGARGAR